MIFATKICVKRFSQCFSCVELTNRSSDQCGHTQCWGRDRSDRGPFCRIRIQLLYLTVDYKKSIFIHCREKNIRFYQISTKFKWDLLIFFPKICSDKFVDIFYSIKLDPEPDTNANPDLEPPSFKGRIQIRQHWIHYAQFQDPLTFLRISKGTFLTGSQKDLVQS